MSILYYDVKATKEVCPDTVELTFFKKETGDTSAEVIGKIEEDRKNIKEWLEEKASFDRLSYRQRNVSVRRIVEKEKFAVNKITGKSISLDAYDSLSPKDKEKWNIAFSDKFIGYEATISIYGSLKYGKTVVKDFTDIFSKTVTSQINCSYFHTLSEEAREAVENDLFSECIIKGTLGVTQIIAKAYDNEKKTIELLEVGTPKEVGTSYKYGMVEQAKARTLSADSEQPVILPELVEQLFKNTMPIEKSLTLKFSF